MNSNQRNALQCHSYLVPNLDCAPTHSPIHCIKRLFPQCYCNTGADLEAAHNERQVFVCELKVFHPEACAEI